jgi:uncharacterized membrane protein YkvA (DUF1232 family)
VREYMDNLKNNFQKKIVGLKKRAKELKKNIGVLYLAYKHPKTPWYAKIMTALVVVYALSPIDLIPDFIPVLGYLDDLILIPAGITLSFRLIPREVIDDCRKSLDENENLKSKGIIGGIIIALIWIFIIYLILRKIF